MMSQLRAKRESKGDNGKLCTADTTIVTQITWLHNVLFMCSGEQAMYEKLDSMPFITGYITVMARVPEHIKSRMLLHLQKLKDDGEAYGWEGVPHTTLCGSSIWSRASHME